MVDQTTWLTLRNKEILISTWPVQLGKPTKTSQEIPFQARP
jgi:hypothetical protein